MTDPRVESIACMSPTGLHRMAYYDWGDPDNPDVVLCVHGLTRHGRDFDALAQRLQQQFRVICPDIVGRGLSDWLAQPQGYAVPQYVADMVTLLGRIQPQRLHWVGTSMGGLIGMSYGGLVARASLPPAQMPPTRLTATIAEPVVPVAKMVLNDVGPRVEPVSLLRIAQYLTDPKTFETFSQAVEYMRSTSTSFGPHTDAQWEQFTRHYFVDKDGWWVKHYDPGIAAGFSVLNEELMARGEKILWAAYGARQAPTLILHGAASDLLKASTVQQMLALNPQAQSVTFEGVGHAPSLLIDAQIDVVERFLRED